MDKNRWMEIITGVQIHLHMFSFRFISSSDILVKTSKLRPPRWYKDHGSPHKSGVLTEEGGWMEHKGRSMCPLHETQGGGGGGEGVGDSRHHSRPRDFQ